MIIEIPDNEVLNNSLGQGEIRLEVAILFYEKEIYSLGKAAEFAGCSKSDFINELKGRGLYLHYDMADVLQDAATLRQLPLYGSSK